MEWQTPLIIGVYGTVATFAIAAFLMSLYKDYEGRTPP